MPVTIAASSSTHFLWNGNPIPRVYRVVPHGALDARLESAEDRTWMLVPLGSAVSGSEPANRDALVAALASIVSPAAGGGGGGGGASAEEINSILKSSPQPSTQIAATANSRSGSIGAGSIATIPANANRLGGYVQNPNVTGVLKVKEGGEASATNGYRLEPGEPYQIRSKGAVSIWSELGGTYEAVEYV